jgi:hypothetical protein
LQAIIDTYSYTPKAHFCSFQSPYVRVVDTNRKENTKDIVVTRIIYKAMKEDNMKEQGLNKFQYVKFMNTVNPEEVTR